MSLSIPRAEECRTFTPEQVHTIRFLLCPYHIPLADFDKDLPDYLSNNYSNFVPFAYRVEGEKLVGHCGYIRSDGTSDDCLYDGLPLGVDVYCCSNGYKKRYRSDENLLCVYNLVIDLDCHNNSISIENLNSHIDSLEPRLLNSIQVAPNFIHHTGRGLQLWYSIEPCHIKLKSFCLSASVMLCKMFESALSELGETILSVDKGSSTRLSGLFRLPFSYNTVACRWSTGTLYHEDRPNIVDLCNKLNSFGYFCYDFAPKRKSSSVIPPRWSRFKSSVTSSRYTPCFLYRKRVLDSILYTDGITEGHRNYLLFAYYMTMYNLIGEDDAQTFVTELNSSLASPLPDKELRHIFSSFRKKKYRYTDKEFFSLIGYTKKSLSVPSKKALAKMEVKKKKDSRNEKILSLHESGLSVSAIAREVGCTRPTVYSVLKLSTSESSGV